MNLAANGPPTWESRARADTMARTMAYRQWRKEARAAINLQRAKEAADPLHAGRAPAPKYYACILAGVPTMALHPPITNIGQYRPTAYGSGTRSSLLSIQSHHPGIFIRLHRARLGRLGLFTYPFWPTRLPKKKVQAHEALRRRLVFSTTNCNLCNLPKGDFVHLCTTCTHPAITQRRNDVMGNGKWATGVLHIMDVLYAAHRRPIPVGLANDIRAMDLNSDEARFITARITACAPWTPSEADPTWVTASRIGGMLDREMPIGWATTFANTWTICAHEVLVGVCGKWWTLLSNAGRARIIAAKYTLPAA